MRHNRIVICITIIALFLIIGYPTITKFKQRNIERAEKVLENKLKTTAISCWKEEICQNNIVYLKDLQENNFIGELTNPITNKHLSEQSFVTKKDGKYEVSISY